MLRGIHEACLGKERKKKLGMCIHVCICVTHHPWNHKPKLTAAAYYGNKDISAALSLHNPLVTVSQAWPICRSASPPSAPTRVLVCLEKLHAKQQVGKHQDFE
jgi:hypothetical protein